MIGRNSISFSESTPRSSFTSSSAAAYSSFASFLATSFFLALEQFLRGFPPSAEVVFVKYHEVPIHRVQPFVLLLRLDVSCCVASPAGPEKSRSRLPAFRRSILVGSLPELRERYCQPSKST